MLRKILITLILLSFSIMTACIDPVTNNRGRDNNTNIKDNSSTNDNTTAIDNESFLKEPEPPTSDGVIIVTDDMLRPHGNNYVSPYNYAVSNNFLIIDGGKERFEDVSLSKVDPCTKEFYDALTPDIFRSGNRIYITNRKQLNEFNRIYSAEYNPTKASNIFILAKDIDLCSMTDPEFRPIGIPSSGMTSFFWPTFDGDNHIVKNLYVKRDGYEGFDCAGFICGLAGAYESGKLQNIGVSGRIEITAGWAGGSNRGVGVVGWTSGGEIRNVVSNLNISAINNVGGIVGMITTGQAVDGYAKPTYISNVKNYANIIGQSNVGGIVGYAMSGNYINANEAEHIYSSIVNWGNITATDSNTVGGLFGVYQNFNNKKPNSCKNGGKPVKLYGTSNVFFGCE